MLCFIVVKSGVLLIMPLFAPPFLGFACPVGSSLSICLGVQEASSFAPRFCLPYWVVSKLEELEFFKPTVLLQLLLASVVLQCCSFLIFFDTGILFVILDALELTL